jgi:hypothetical protein
MMPQKEVSEAIHQQADPAYGRYEGTQTSTARQHDEPSYEQELREGPSGKVYPLPRDNMNILRFWIPLIALAMLLLFGLLFVVVVGGTTGWISFAVAGFVIMTVLAYSAYLYRPFGD